MKTVITREEYGKLCDVIDRVKTDERSLDTDQYAGAIMEALGLSFYDDEPRQPASWDLCSMRDGRTTHYRCDQWPDGTVTDIATGVVVVYPQPGAPRGFDR